MNKILFVLSLALVLSAIAVSADPTITDLYPPAGQGDVLLSENISFNVYADIFYSDISCTWTINDSYYGDDSQFFSVAQYSNNTAYKTVSLISSRLGGLDVGDAFKIYFRCFGSTGSPVSVTRYYNVTAAPCFPDWSCDGYGSCLTNDTAPCNSVTDNNSCGDNYTGDYSEFSPQSCDYCSPSWSCDGYETCVAPAINASCNSANDSNDCYATTGLSSDQYAGNYTEFSSQACAYAPSAGEAATGTLITLFAILLLVGLVITVVPMKGMSDNMKKLVYGIIGILGIITILAVLL